jgi:hypothetical protein
VLPELRNQLEIERHLLRRLLDEQRSLVSECRTRAPTNAERTILAATLHAFYNGVENVFKRIAAEFDGGVPGGPSAHRDLLDAMARPGTNRPRVISDDLRDALDPYLDFRHLFRHAYTFNIQWELMADSVFRCEATLRLLEDEIDRFLSSLGGEA